MIARMMQGSVYTTNALLAQILAEQRRTNELLALVAAATDYLARTKEKTP